MDGVRVVEFGAYYAGPLLGRYLAGLGCEVTSVERPMHARGALEECMRMKEIQDELRHSHTSRLRLDLTEPRDRERAWDVVRSCDILIENYAPGIMERLGFGHSECCRENESLVYVSLPGFAEDGTHDGVCAYEAILMASAGVFRNMGINRTLLGIPASFTHLPLASVYGSFMALLAVLGAMYGNRRDRHVVVPLASALSETMVHNSLRFAMDECYMNPRQRRLHGKPNTAISPNELHQLFCPFFRIYLCSDSRAIYLVCPAHALHQRRALRVLGVEDQVLRCIGVVDPYHSGPLSGLGTGSLSPEQSRIVYPILKRAFCTKSASEWERRLGEAQVPVCVVQSTDEWRESAHAHASGLVDRCGHVAPPVWTCDSRTVPLEEEEGGDDSGDLPLSGITVLDMCNVIAGPTVGAYLSQLGAEVVKIDAPTPNYSPEVTVFYGIACNAGKKSILLDVMDVNGRRALNAMLRRADVLLINCTSEALKRLRLTRDDLATINPRLVLCRFDAWGGPIENGGHMSRYIGYDDCVQAGIGIMHRFGGGDPEEHAHIGTIDHIAGVAGASSVVAALLARKRHGRVCTARASLVSVGQYLQIPFMVPGCQRLSLGCGRSCIGEHPWYAAHQCTDGWIFVATNEPLRQDAPRVEHLSVDDACLTLRKIRGVEAVPLVSLDDLRHRNIVPQRDASIHAPTFQFLHHLDHPIGGSLIMVAFHCIRGIRTHPLTHAPKYGRDTRVVLSHYMTYADVTRLFLTRAASGAWSRSYIPFSHPCDRCGARGRSLVLLSACGHSVCSQCALNRRRCSVCRTPTSSEDQRMELTAWRQWRRDYASWRRGESRGARGECVGLKRDGSCHVLVSRTRDHGTRSTSVTSLTCLDIAE